MFPARRRSVPVTHRAVRLMLELALSRAEVSIVRHMEGTMREPIGHDDVRRSLERFLPPVTLFFGNKGTGAWAMGDYLLRFHGIQAVDILKVIKLDAQSATIAGMHMLMTSIEGGDKGLLLNLDRPPQVDQDVHERNLNRLLVPLEEGNGKIILLASLPTLPTIESRAIKFHLGLLSNEEVQRTLLRLGMQAGYDDAMKLGGTLHGKAQLDAEVYLKSNVDSVLKALQDRDRLLFNVSLQGWRNTQDGVVALKMLRGWMYEALIGKWVRYSADAAPSLAKDREKLKAMLVDLDHYQGNPKIIAHAALDKHLGR
jgi:hypothetical protein